MYLTIKNEGGVAINVQRAFHPLDQYIHSIYEIKGKPILGCERIFPRNGVEIIFNLGEPFQLWSASDQTFRTIKDCTIIGTRTGYLDYKTFPEVHQCAIRFTLNGFYNLFNIGQNDFGDSYYSYTNVLPKNTKFIRERLLSKKSTPERLDVLNNWIKELYRNKLDKSLYIVTYLIEKIKSNPKITIKDLEKNSGFSIKHLFKCFKNEIGISPKQFQRVTRFNHVIENIQKNPNWQDISFDLDFYDQSHLIREVNHFAGVCPNQLLKSPIRIMAGVMPVQRDWR